MAKFYTELNESLRQFIAAQRIFFNASAPNQGRINISPKGLDTFRVLSARRVGYLDLTGSENETAAHVAENGRLTLMFCSFDGKPLILRLYGRGRVVRSGGHGFAAISRPRPQVSGCQPRSERGRKTGPALARRGAGVPVTRPGGPVSRARSVDPRDRHRPVVEDLVDLPCAARPHHHWPR